MYIHVCKTIIYAINESISSNISYQSLILISWECIEIVSFGICSGAVILNYLIFNQNCQDTVSVKMFH